MLPLRPPAGKPAPLVCTYAATGHNSAVLSLDVTEDLMFTGSKGWFVIFHFCSYLRNELVLSSGHCLEDNLSPPFASMALLSNMACPYAVNDMFAVIDRIDWNLENKKQTLFFHRNVFHSPKSIRLRVKKNGAPHFLLRS